LILLSADQAAISFSRHLQAVPRKNFISLLFMDRFL
jgi:hypothetical protein